MQISGTHTRTTWVGAKFSAYIQYMYCHARTTGSSHDIYLPLIREASRHIMAIRAEPMEHVMLSKHISRLAMIIYN